MSTYVLVFGACCACGQRIHFNPDRVPSLRIDGVRQPLCFGCAERWNAIHRTAKGLPPVPIAEDAYEPKEEP